jgi:4-hydroxy-3-methylbut-2-enyl diphosphate reductase
VGLLGQTANSAILINSEEDIEQIDFSKPVFMFSQTTMSIPEYNHLSQIIRQRLDERNPGSGSDTLMTIHNTICGQVSNREPRLRQFAQTHDIVIFVSGKESSNGKMLFEVCRSENRDSYMVISPDQLDREWFKGKKFAGVCGATSTPKWLIDSVADTIRKID